MLYTPVPGTPLYTETAQNGDLLDGIDLADIHGQYKFNFRHRHIGRDESNSWLERAFARDYEANGPSLFRIMQTTFRGWTRYHDDDDARVRARFAREGDNLRHGHGAALWAMEAFLRRSQAGVSDRIRTLRRQVEKEFAGLTPLIDRVAGLVLLHSARREFAKYPLGRPLEPMTFVDRRC
jgi:hypothetical protein